MTISVNHCGTLSLSYISKYQSTESTTSLSYISKYHRGSKTILIFWTHFLLSVINQIHYRDNKRFSNSAFVPLVGFPCFRNFSMSIATVDVFFLPPSLYAFGLYVSIISTNCFLYVFTK